VELEFGAVLLDENVIIVNQFYEIFGWKRAGYVPYVSFSNVL